jgi:type III restriction enzyme
MAVRRDHRRPSSREALGAQCRSHLLVYWLPTATDRFYPEFVDELQDGRVVVIEYKSADRSDNADSRQKRNIGNRVAEVSDGRVLFWWAQDASSGNLSSEQTQLVGR